MYAYFPVVGRSDSFNGKIKLRRFNISHNSKFKLGRVCKANHSAKDVDGNSLNMSIRYNSTGSCWECQRLTSKRAQYARCDEVGESEINKARARSRLEDMRNAKEMGLTLEEYCSE